ncbi:hypothetical protein BKA62DRAFT_680445 [Auriculariales sp. MPI-PUGE-AT-0066]|nr:hypothetical protein BKA62DRAFT_680445 [Auriculariales sp. MPI-PUGE-AT-0066]
MLTQRLRALFMISFKVCEAAVVRSMSHSNSLNISSRPASSFCKKGSMAVTLCYIQVSKPLFHLSSAADTLVMTLL